MTTGKIAEAFFAITKRLGYVDSPANNVSGQPEVAKKVGNAFFDYMIASIYDCDWEGYTELQLEGIAALMRDFQTAVENGLINIE